MTITSQKIKSRQNTVQGACLIPSSGSHASWRSIPLSQGQFTIVDNDMYEYLNQWKWCAHWHKNTQSFYAVRTQYKNNNKFETISMAREILGLKKGDKRQADHKNHDTLNNLTLNLRIVTHQGNRFNLKNTKGYSWHKTAKKYKAEITVSGKVIYLGLFGIAKEARNAYLKAKKLYHRI